MHEKKGNFIFIGVQNKPMFDISPALNREIMYNSQRSGRQGIIILMYKKVQIENDIG